VSHREDEFIAQTAQASRGKSLADVLTEVQDAHEQLISRVERLTDDQWQQPSPYQQILIDLLEQALHRQSTRARS